MTCGRGFECAGSLAEPGCGRHFGGLNMFDRHFRTRKDPPGPMCLTDDELRSKLGLVRNEHGVWVDGRFRRPFPTDRDSRGPAPAVDGGGELAAPDPGRTDGETPTEKSEVS